MTRHLLSWAPAILWAALLFFFSAQSDLPGAGLFPLSDKAAHALMFGIFGLALAWGSRNISGKRELAGLILLGVLFAASDEWHQAFVPRRQPSPGDFLADVAGLVCGFVMARMLLKRRSCRDSEDL
ncbi:MAG: VanZ family protein [Gemmatimonadota bacterium]